MLKKILSKSSKVVSKVHLPYTRKRVTQLQIEKALSVLKPGDLILTHVDGELSNIVLSHWSHAGISNMGRVYEATTKGVVASWFVYFLAHKDEFKILRPTFDFDHIGLVTFLESAKGLPYDFEFETNDKQFYCFELAAVAYMQVSNVVINPSRTPAGYQYLAKSFSSDLFKEVHI